MSEFYTEDIKLSGKYRINYKNSVESLIGKLAAESAEQRNAYMKDFANSAEEYRMNFCKLLGKPLADGISTEIPQVKTEFVTNDGLCDISRLEFTTKEGLYFYGLLMKPQGIEKAPLIIAQHGGGGTPELCSEIHGKNKYNKMVRRLLEKGNVVFAPQVMLWNRTEKVETMPMYDEDYNRFHIDRDLKHFGYTLVSLEIYLITQSINYLETLTFVDCKKIGMMGMSYGGFFTLHTMAVDKRIKSGYCCAFFNDRIRYDYPDWVWWNSANRMMDAEVAALCAPRRLYLEVGKEDPVFDYKTAIPEAERAMGYYKMLGCENQLRFDIWDGGHTVNTEDKGYDFFLEGFK